MQKNRLGISHTIYYRATFLKFEISYVFMSKFGANFINKNSSFELFLLCFHKDTTVNKCIHLKIEFFLNHFVVS